MFKTSSRHTSAGMNPEGAIPADAAEVTQVICSVRDRGGKKKIEMHHLLLATFRNPLTGAVLSLLFFTMHKSRGAIRAPGWQFEETDICSSEKGKTKMIWSDSFEKITEGRKHRPAIGQEQHYDR